MTASIFADEAECWNEEWATEHGEDVEWARTMWYCPCEKCSNPELTRGEAMTESLTSDEAATREVGWIAREAAALVAERVPQDSPRWAAYTSRKHALLDYIERSKRKGAEDGPIPPPAGDPENMNDPAAQDRYWTARGHE